MRTGTRSFALIIFLSVIGLILFLTWPYFVLWSAARNINKLYASHRPFAYRWTDAPYCPLQPQTQKDTEQLQSDLDSLTTQILKVEDHFPLNPRPLQLLGRIYLLNSQLDTVSLNKAISQYRSATLMSPDDPQLKLELGIALALQAKNDSQPLEYEAALQQMLVASRHMTNAEAFF